MKIHEYQAKNVLREFGIATPHGALCVSAEKAVEAAREMVCGAWVLKAQIHAGGRGKGGGVKVAASLTEVGRFASEMLGMKLVTPQTGPQGQIVRKILVEPAADIRKEFYVAMLVDRSARCTRLVASSEGGMDIEAAAKRMPEAIHALLIDTVRGAAQDEMEDIARRIGIPGLACPQAGETFQSMYRAFTATDALLLEINPLALTGDGQVVAVDAKMNFDDNALFRHPEIAALRDLDEEDPVEIEASAHDLSYISLSGDIGCLVNGAGLAMATMDIIKLYGGNPANFLDVGGGATAGKVAEAFKLMLRNQKLKAILVNIFGGIMRCDVIAEGVVAAGRDVKLTVPLVVRLEGTNVELGRKILSESHLPIILASSMNDAAEKVVRVSGSPAHLRGGA
jgi:succinyl-CoA synthetase beta subunit